MQTKAKANSVVTHALVPEGIQFNVLGAGSFVFDYTQAAQSNRTHAEIHGWLQRIVDAAAIGRDPETGRSATPMEKLTAMQELAAHYEGGNPEWSRKGGGGDTRAGNLTIRALANVRGWTDEKATTEATRIAVEDGITLQKLLTQLRTRPGRVRDVYDTLLAAEKRFDAEDALSRMGD